MGRERTAGIRSTGPYLAYSLTATLHKQLFINITHFLFQEPELYFTDPQQLLSILTEMEEQNFSYLCNFQETEKEMNEFQHIFIDTQKRK